MKRFIYPLFALALGACVDEATTTREDLGTVAAPYTVAIQGESCVTLVAGQHIDVGTVCATIVGDNLRFTYTTTGGWLLRETHLWVGTSAPTENIPPGSCPYKDEFATPIDTFSYDVPLTTFGFFPDAECVPATAYAMAHAAVGLYVDGNMTQEETAYGQGPGIPGGNWAMYFTIDLICETEPPPPPPPKTCETVFAFGGDLSTCFIGMTGVDANRWGWTNGPLELGTYSFDLYAGAGQCKLDNGLLTGTVDMVYGPGGIELTMTALEGVTFDETHVYVGATPLPIDRRGNYTVAPGQFPFGHDLTDATTDSFTIPASGPVYVVIHGVMCW